MELNDKVEVIAYESNNLKVCTIGTIKNLNAKHQLNMRVVELYDESFYFPTDLFSIKLIDNRPTWRQYFINISHQVKTRSHDIQTQHGCVITDADNHIISTGYNGFPPGVNDSDLPKERPEKYPYILHAEENAILNARTSLNGCRIYVTGKPCVACLRRIMAVGITHIYYDGTKPSYQLEEEESIIFNRLLKMSNISIIKCI